MATNTKTVRILLTKYHDAVRLKEQEEQRHTPVSDAYTSSETAWLSYLIDLGIKRYLGNRKM
jgi:hypothetical protein